MEEESQKETVTAEFEKKRKDAEDQADAKTAKNRAKRQKKKERAKTKGNNEEGSAVKSSEADDKNESNVPIKKRRLVSGRELVFRKPGEESDGSEGEEDDAQDKIVGPEPPTPVEEISQHVETARLTIHEDD